MTQALRQLAEDFLSAIVFFLIYALTGSLYAGVALAVAIGFAQVVQQRMSRRAIEPLQWMSLAPAPPRHSRRHRRPP